MINWVHLDKICTPPLMKQSWGSHLLKHPGSWILLVNIENLSPFTTVRLTFWHRSFTFNSNKSPTWCNNFSVYYSDLCLQLNMFRAFSRPSSGAQWLQWQPLVLPLYRGDSRAVFVVGPARRLARPRTQYDCHHNAKVKPEATTAVI
jgi:hypothetical protein